MKKKILSLLVSATLSLTMLPAASVIAFAADADNMTYSFVLSTAASSVKVGQEITFQAALNRTDDTGDYLLYSMQDEIVYDSTFFSLVPGSVQTSSANFSSSTRDMSDNIHKKIIISFVDLSGAGVTQSGSLPIGTFTLKAMKDGTTKIENTDYKVNKSTGLESYKSTSESLQIKIAKAPGTGGVGGGGGGESSITTIPSSEVPAGAAGVDAFVDVNETDWFYDSVKYAIDNGLFNGTSDATFSPESAMTRSMLATVLYRLEGSPAVGTGNTFADADGDAWYANAITWASQNGIVQGYGTNLFGTNDSITREQMAAMLYRYAKFKGYDTTATTDLSTYSDAGDVSTWAQEAMAWANAEKLINGVTDTTLVPGGNATRAQVAAILMRFSENIVK